MLKQLIGAQILKINEDSIEVSLNGNTHILEITSDDGDCCGYADFKTNMLYSENNGRNPIITNVELVDSDGYDSASSVVTFYGENKEIANIESRAGSGSGWSYGALVKLRCRTLGIGESLVSW